MLAAIVLAFLVSALPPPPPTPSEPPLLELRELLTVEAGNPEVAPRVRALSGQRVRLRGWLVVFEEAPDDGFWLAPRPVFQDESGAGSGDLPPASVRVTAPVEVLARLPDDATPLEVMGTLRVGRMADAAGRPSIISLHVDSLDAVRRLERRTTALPPPGADRPDSRATAAIPKEEHR